MSELAHIPTEGRNPASERLDELPTLEMLRVMQVADQEGVAAVERELPRIAAAVDAIAARIEAGGRLFYLGAGTSGRLGVMDASECPPTYNTPRELVQGIIAGGEAALSRATETTEDDPAIGVKRRAFHAGGVVGHDEFAGGGEGDEAAFAAQQLLLYGLAQSGIAVPGGVPEGEEPEGPINRARAGPPRG